PPLGPQDGPQVNAADRDEHRQVDGPVGYVFPETKPDPVPAQVCEVLSRHFVQVDHTAPYACGAFRDHRGTSLQLEINRNLVARNRQGNHQAVFLRETADEIRFAVNPERVENGPQGIDLLPAIQNLYAGWNMDVPYGPDRRQPRSPRNRRVHQ